MEGGCHFGERRNDFFGVSKEETIFSVFRRHNCLICPPLLKSDEAHVAHLIESISLKEHEFLSGLKIVAFLA